MKYDKIYVDLDGVLVNLTKGLAAHHGIDLVKYPYPEPGTFISFEDWFGVDDVFSGFGSDFWRQLPYYSWTTTLIAVLKELDVELIIASTPTHDGRCYLGKYNWVRNAFGTEQPNIMFGTHKGELGAPGSLLIDDFDSNCNHFKGNGGDAILFPQLWNTNHENCDRRISYVLEALF